MTRTPFLTVFALLLAACASASAPVRGQSEAMVVAANPHAVDAGVKILRAGGNAVDAAVAVEAVLGLVEPQSSGVGGGGFMMHYDSATHQIIAYEGREAAPAGATADMFLANGRPLPFLDAQASGRSTGTPSVFAMLKLAHDERGKLPWAQLFEPAIRLAESGFQVSPRLARILALWGPRSKLKDDPAARAYFFDASGNPRPVGYLLRNPEYAATLRAIAAQGPDALTHGPIADDIVAAIHREPYAGTMTLADLQAYRPHRLQPVCGNFRVYRVCGPPPPSAGGTSVVALLGLFERARPKPEGIENLDDWSAFLWASRLAYADREHYVADPAQVPVPTRELVAPSYLDQRAHLIDLAHPAARVGAGQPAGRAAYERWGHDVAEEVPGTSHMAIVDHDGNAVSMTATVESVFGSQRLVHGFFLNNQLTDFSFQPALNGRPIANAVAPFKRPRSSMSPTIITNRQGQLAMVVGSPGGSAIIGYVARTTIGVLDWKQTPQQAVDFGNVIASAPAVRMESARLPAPLAQGLRARGWQLQENAQEESGIHVILVTRHGLIGGADSRREGVVASIPTPN